MYCKNCGTKLMDGAPFCPNCGVKAGESKPANASGTSKANNPEKVIPDSHKSKSPEKAAGSVEQNTKGLVKTLCIAVLVIAIAVTGGIFGYRAIVKKKISEAVNSTMAMVKSGVDDETANQIFQQVVPALVEDETIASLITANIDGGDVMDIYGSMMLAFQYQVGTPVRVGKNHYQVDVTIQNLNNNVVFANVVNVLKERYTGKGILKSAAQIISDLGSDYSETIAEIITDSAEEVYQTNNSDYFIQATFTLDIQKVDGTWKATNDFSQMVMPCLGLSN